MDMSAHGDIYRIGGPTHVSWQREVAAVDKVIIECDALVTDPEDGWVGVDPAKLAGETAGGLSLVERYQGLVQTGYWHGWIAA